jgi:hypothetical protein
MDHLGVDKIDLATAAAATSSTHTARAPQSSASCPRT